MKLLATAAEVNDELIRLIEACSSCQVAVAWASVGFEAFKRLAKNSKKIEKMVVGTHFFQTDPEFIETFLTSPTTRFVLQKDSQGRVFHPKVYLFEMADDEWECLVGSPNFTWGGVCNNDEAAVLVTQKDRGAEEFLIKIEATISGYWKKAATLSPSDLEAYRNTWEMKRPALREVQGPIQFDSILTCSWEKYFEMLRLNSERVPRHYSIDGRLKVIREVQSLFASEPHFKDIARQKRKCIAGTLHYKHGIVGGVDFLWFGSMFGVGKFQRAINENDPNLSLALDAIPSNGAVAEADYLTYVERFKRAFPEGRDGLSTATRLLAMKRPDVFICLSSKNERNLYNNFGVPRVNPKDYQKYWDSIIVPIMDSPWWKSSPPPSGVEREVWEARTAFLDCLYYEGIDLPVA